MSETLIEAEQDQPPPVPQEATAGALLRQIREQSGLHIAALAVSIKVPVKKLEALEADRLDLLPDAVFARALASSICRALKVDPGPVLARLPQSGVPRLWSDSSGMNVPFSSPRDNVSTSFWSQFPKPVLGVVLLLLIGTLVLVFYPADPVADSEPAKLVSSEVVSPLPINVMPAQPLPAVATAPVPAMATTAVPGPAAAAGPVAAVQNPAKPVANEVLVFKTKEPSWVEVTDAQGTSQFRRIVLAGETVGVSGVLPLSVVIGRADVTEVWVRGKALALDSIARENVARFEVK